MHDWICALAQDCVSYQSIKSKQRRNNEVPLENCETETQLFRTVHFHNKGLLNPPSHGYSHCLLIIDAFSRNLIAYPVTDTGAQSTIHGMLKEIMHYGIPQSIIHERGTAFVNTHEFVNWTKIFGIALRPRTANSPRTNDKIETQNQHIARYWRTFLNKSGNNCAPFTAKFVFAHSTSVNYTTEKTPYQIVYCNKSQILMSLKLFCKGTAPQCHSENQVKHQLLNGILRPQLSQSLLEIKTAFKKVYTSTYEKSRSEKICSITRLEKQCQTRKSSQRRKKSLLENNQGDRSINQKLQHLRLGHFTVPKRITNTTYRLKND